MQEEENILTIDDMKRDLRGWGIGLIIIGIISLILSGFLSAMWGKVLIGLGIITLLFPVRGMFILLGVALIIVGVMNITGGGGWMFFGILQIYWGIRELMKYGKYASVESDFL